MKRISMMLYTGKCLTYNLLILVNSSVLVAKRARKERDESVTVLDSGRVVERNR